MGKRSKGSLWEEALACGKTYCEYSAVCRCCAHVVNKSSTVEDWDQQLARGLRDSMNSHKVACQCPWTATEAQRFEIRCKMWQGEEWHTFPDAMPDLLGPWQPEQATGTAAPLGVVFAGLPGFDSAAAGGSPLGSLIGTVIKIHVFKLL